MEIQEIAQGLVWLIFPVVLGVLWHFYKKDNKTKELAAMADRRKFEAHIEEQKQINEFLKLNLAELKIITKYHDDDIKRLRE